MKFKLIYFGQLLTNPKHRSSHIADIRMQFHPQLKKLTKYSPWNLMTQYMGKNHTKQPIITKTLGGIEWNSIITPKLKLIAELDIQLLHQEIIGVPHSDIDNRIKTLLDGLRSPQTEKEIGDTTPNDIGPIYTLLDDDHLVTKLSVNTSHLLTTNMFKKPITSEDVFLMINVNVKVSEGNIINLPFMA